MKIAISTCPNDTFIFAALLMGKVQCPYEFDLFMDDVEVLNKKALSHEFDIIKVSYGVVGRLMDEYAILPTGGAMGYGVGPLFLAKSKDITHTKIAIAGFNTTSFKVFSTFYPELVPLCVEDRFDRIMPGIRDGKYTGGVVIHEGRFTFPEYGLQKIADLGELWQGKFSSPLPLGAIILRRKFADIAPVINQAILDSINYAYNYTSDIMPFVKEYSDEMSEDVMKSHIKLYVNEYSKDARIGQDGIKLLLDNSDIFHKI